MRTLSATGLLLTASFALATAAQAQEAQDGPAYEKEFVYGINFNSNAGLIGGASIRSSRLLSDDWSRFWMVEGVEVKGVKERRRQNPYTGGVYVSGKSNYLFVLRPSVGVQRVIFRKAPESGVQVSGLMGAGPSFGLLMPYYIYYDYTPRDANQRPIPPEDIRAEQFDPDKHFDENLIYDRAPIFSGLNELKPNVGAHLRGALTFEYGRYRDAVAGLEAGFLVEAYPRKLTVLRALGTADADINNSVFSSVYVTLYIGQRK